MCNRVHTVFRVLLCVSFAACSDLSDPSGAAGTEVFGTWLWVRSVGGFAGQVVFPETGTVTYDFYSPSGAFIRTRNGAQLERGRYALLRQNGGLLISWTDLATAENNAPFGNFEKWVYRDGDTLHLADNGMDLYRHTFVRVSSWPFPFPGEGRTVRAGKVSP